jgi:transposase
MPLADASLPDDPAAQKAIIAALERHGAAIERRATAWQQRHAEMEQRHAEVQRRHDALQVEFLRLQVELLRLKKQVYGPRADRLQTHEQLAQLLLAFAQEQAARPVNPDDLAAGAEGEPAPRSLRRHRHGRRQLAEEGALPVTRVLHDLEPAQRACPACGTERERIGEESSWQIEYIPAHLERIEHVQARYACRAGEAAAQPAQMERAPKPAAPFERGMAGPGLLAYIVTSKFHDFLPLYRLERILGRLGYEITRGTQSAWCGDVADLLQPLYAQMCARVRASALIATDDTPMPMQQPGKTKKARLWVYLGDEGHPYNVFDFTLSRGRDGPAAFLGEYGGTLLADAFGGYDGVVVSNRMRRAGCHAHSRRRFVDAEPAAPAIAAEALGLYRQLDAVEVRARALAPAGRLALRQHESAPLLATLRQRLLQWKLELLPKHPMAEAVNYALDQWDTLTVFLEDGAVPIDNNGSEREMKRVVLNRKNSLFVGNPRAGRTMAILASLTSTCFRHRIDPQRYLTQLLMNLPAAAAAELPAWLPDQWKLRTLAPPA